MRHLRISKSMLGAGMIFLALVLFVALKPSSAMDQDLGRHLKLGELILETGRIPASNLFSYTHSDFPFVNHHWLSEVILFLVFKAYGAGGIVALKFFLLALAYGIAFYSAFRLSGSAGALAAGLLFFMFAGERVDERPELFGFVFFALLFHLLFAARGLRRRFLFLAVFVIMAVWVNFHVSFVFGLLLIALYGAGEVSRLLRARAALPRYFLPIGLGFTAVFAVMVNPRGLYGAAYPLFMFGNYGYKIVENQSLFFLLPRIANPLIPPFFFVVGGMVIFLIIAAVLERRVLPMYVVWSVCAVLTALMIRNMSFFALSGIPVAAHAFGVLGLRVTASRIRAWGKTALPVLSVLGLALILGFVGTRSVAYSFPESGKRGVDFLLARQLPPNIFNNFDIGGYLDYRLFPAYRTFVDNRPEAFPKEFFEEYIRIQEDRVFREEAFRRYGIRTVVFGRNDATPWAQRFLAEIVRDPEWRLVYKDEYLLILTRRV